jgi:hypothetical protein
MSNENEFMGLGFLNPELYYTETEKAIAVLDEGWARSALCLRTGGLWRFGHGRNYRCQSLPQVRAALDVWRDRSNAGNTMALLQAIQLCSDENLPLPSWLAAAFSSAMTAFLLPGGAHSLDIVFKSPSLPTNTPSKAAAARQDWQLGGELWCSCWDCAKANEQLASLDAVLDVVLAAKPWGVKKRKARELVARIDESQAQHSHKREKQPLARFLEKRRKA